MIMKFKNLFLFFTLIYCVSIYAQLKIPASVPENIKKMLVSVKVIYYNFNGEIKTGNLIVNKSVEKEVKQIFDELLKNKFPIEKINDMNIYNWSDNLSMEDNNTVAFNYRINFNKGELSKHAYGLAIDINPKYNPCFCGKTVKPKNGVYDITKKGTITKDSFIVKLFKKYNWSWGGTWQKVKDYQHFEKKGNL